MLPVAQRFLDAPPVLDRILPFPEPGPGLLVCTSLAFVGDADAAFELVEDPES